jgi:hypothetical protein
VIRRRAEYCRFCTARQDGAAPVSPEGAVLAVGAPPAAFEPAWDADEIPAAAHDEQLQLELTAIAVTTPSAGAADDEWVFEDPGPRDLDDAPPPPPGHFPSTLAPRVRLDPPLPDLDRAEQSNGNANGSHPSNNGNNGHNGHARPSSDAASDPARDDALLGFEHFPEAAPVPDVRWG